MPSQSHNQGHDLSAGEQIQTEISSEYIFKVQIFFINSPILKKILIIHIKKEQLNKIQQEFTTKIYEQSTQKVLIFL